MYHFRLCERLERNTVNYVNSVGNVVKALKTRVYILQPQWLPGPKLQEVMDKAARRLAQQIGPELDEEGIERILSLFPSKKRQMYGEALKVALDLRKHARITTFIKQENVPLKDADKPRVIQFRDPVFLAHLLAALKPLEHAFYHGRYLFNGHQKFTCAKGLDLLARMKCLERMVRDLEDPVVCGLDGSAFDAHVGVEALKCEWRFYERTWKSAGYHPSTIRKMRLMGRAQLINKCRATADDGTVKYKVLGNRMSGDLNTGLGNSVLQSGFIAAAMAILGIPEKHWRMLVDGDDAVLMVSGRYQNLLARLPVIFASFSQDVKVEAAVKVTIDTMEVIEFCQARPVKIAGKWRLVRSPYKVYNGYKMVNIHYNDLEGARRFFGTVAPAEMIYARGVPVLSSLFKAMYKLSEGAKPLESVSNRYWLRNCERISERIPPTTEVTWEARLSFNRAFGISEGEQLSIETELEAWEAASVPHSASNFC